MELSQLKYFLAVAETEHITNSAKMLHISQPSLTQSLHRLEAELGVDLFERVGRGIRLTSAGRYLQTLAQTAVDDFDGIVPEMQAFTASRQHIIRITVEDAANLATDLIVAYRIDHPDSEFRIIQRNVGNASVDNAGKDLAGLVFDAYMPAVSKRGSAANPTFSFTERVCLAVPLNSDYGRKVALDELDGCNMVRLSRDYRFRIDCDLVCAAHGIHTNVVFESESPLVSQKIISVGLGVGFWGETSWPRLDPGRARLAPIDCKDFEQVVTIDAHSPVDLTPAEQDFLSFCKHRLG